MDATQDHNRGRVVWRTFHVWRDAYLQVKRLQLALWQGLGLLVRRMLEKAMCAWTSHWQHSIKQMCMVQQFRRYQLGHLVFLAWTYIMKQQQHNIQLARVCLYRYALTASLGFDCLGGDCFEQLHLFYLALGADVG